MATVHPRGAGLAADSEGRWLVWYEPGKLVLYDLGKRMIAGEVGLELDPPFELAVVAKPPGRLLLLQPLGGSTLLRVYSVPQLGAVGELRLKGDVRLAAMTHAVALLVGESLIALDLAELRTTPIPVRGPIQVVAPVTDDQVLIGARGKLEAWSLDERRPTHRLGLPVPSDAAFGGLVAGGKMMWFGSAAAPGTLSLYRMADAKQIAQTTAGGAIKAAAADPATATVVLALQEAGKEIQLVVLDLETRARRVVPLDPPAAAFCLTGAPADAIAAIGERGTPVMVPLAASATPAPARPLVPPRVERAARDDGTPADAADTDADAATPTDGTPDAPAAETPTAKADVADRLTQWRAQVQAAIVAVPPRPVPRDGRPLPDEPRSRSRAELYAWGLAARARTTTTPPPPPQGWRITELAARFALDTRSKSLLSLVYASWLDGEGRHGVAVGVIARCLGNDEDAWVDALAQGRLGKLGWIVTRYGRTRLHPTVGRFLDESPAHVELFAPEPGIATLAPPAMTSVWPLFDRAVLPAEVRALADRLRAPVAVIDEAALPAPRRDQALADRVFEAQLHGAVVVIIGAEQPRALDGVAVFVIADATAAPWRGLPAWPPPPEPELEVPPDLPSSDRTAVPADAAPDASAAEGQNLMRIPAIT